MNTILFSADMQLSGMQKVIKHLQQNKYLYWEVGFPINKAHFSFPIIGYIHIKKHGIQFKVMIEDIIPHDPVHYTGSEATKIKPKYWIDEYNANKNQRDWKYTLVFSEIEELPQILDLSQFRKVNNEVVQKPPQNYVRINSIRTTSYGKKRYWKIAPGVDAMIWERCYKDGNIAIGWDELGDLSEYKDDKARLLSKFQKTYAEKHPAKQTGKSTEILNFLQLKIGDIVLANKGTRVIVGIGRVVGDYLFRQDYAEFKHTVPVDWFDVEEKAIPEKAHNISASWFGFTVRELTEDEYLLLLNRGYGTMDQIQSHAFLLDNKKQIIIYGPPGTGKTYGTKFFAVDLLEDRDFLEEFTVLKSQYDSDASIGKAVVDNLLYQSVINNVEKMPMINSKSGKSMIGYKSFSKKANKEIGLVWVEYPSQKSGFFAVHLRKESDGSYPRAEINRLSNYNPSGWGGYPVIKVQNKQDAEVAITLIKYAYDHF